MNFVKKTVLILQVFAVLIKVFFTIFIFKSLFNVWQFYFNLLQFSFKLKKLILNIFFNSGLCSAAAAYIEQCKLSGVELWMPSECVRCNSGSGFGSGSGLRSGSELRSGESTSYQNDAPMSADVVLLVEQTSCLQR